MPSLTDAQRLFCATLNDGPGALAPGLFAGDIDRIVLGLQVHANTISHARLVALEDSFPLTRAEIGEGAFNRLSRDYCDTPAAKAADLTNIGHGFAAHLDAAGAAAAAGDLARIEQAWLESYHAADAVPLDAAALAKLPPAELMDLPVALHPAARLCKLRAPLAATLADVAGLGRSAAAILVVRPIHEVRLVELDRLTAALVPLCAAPTPVGNLLAAACELQDDADPAGPVMTLVGAGALVDIRRGRAG